MEIQLQNDFGLNVKVVALLLMEWFMWEATEMIMIIGQDWATQVTNIFGNFHENYEFNYFFFEKTQAGAMMIFCHISKNPWTNKILRNCLKIQKYIQQRVSHCTFHLFTRILNIECQFSNFETFCVHNIHQILCRN